MGDNLAFLHLNTKNFLKNYPAFFRKKNKKIIKNLNSELGDGDFIFLFIKRY